jgi:hypothetical protein
MAKIPLTLENVESLNRAFGFYFEEGRTRDAEFSAGNLKWPDLESFINDLSDTGGLDAEANYKSAKAVIDKINIDFTESAKETKEDENKANALTEAERQENERIRLEREAAKKAVADSIAKQQAIKAALNDKKIYAKVEASKKPITPNQSTVKFIDEAKKYSTSFGNDFKGRLAQKLKATYPNLTDDEINYLADKTTRETFDVVNNPQSKLLDPENVRNSAILVAAAKENKLIPKLIKDPSILQLSRTAASEVSFVLDPALQTKSILFSFDQNLEQTLFPESRVTFSTKPIQGGYELDFGQLSSGYINLLGSQSNVLNSFGSLVGDELKHFALGQARKFLDSQIANLPTDSGLYNSVFGQQILSSMGLVESGPFSGNIFVGLLQQVPGGSSFFEGVSNIFGVDFSVGAAAPAAEVASGAIAATEGAALVEGATVVGEVAIETGIVAAAGTAAGVAGGAAAGTATGAATGAAVGAVGGPLAIITAVVGAVIGFVASAIPWDKLKKDSQEALAGGLSAAALGISSIGTSLGGFVSGVAGFFGALGSAFLGAIAMPILVTILVFPVVIALIIFIINSGAYVVPPGFSTNINITCNTAQNSGQASPSENPATSAAVCIVSYLNQFHLNPLLVGLLNSPSWNDLAKVLSQPALNALAISAPVDGHLQCVGFVAATAGLAYGQAFGQIDACSYINNPPPGYTYVSGTNGIKPGDFFLINGSGVCSVTSSGHIGVVISVDGILISCADANNVAPGEAQVAHGCFALSQLTGYLRK